MVMIIHDGKMIFMPGLLELFTTRTDLMLEESMAMYHFDSWDPILLNVFFATIVFPLYSR